MTATTKATTGVNTSDDMKTNLRTSGIFASAIIAITAGTRAVANIAIASNDIAELTQDAVSYGKRAIEVELAEL